MTGRPLGVCAAEGFEFLPLPLGEGWGEGKRRSCHRLCPVSRWSGMPASYIPYEPDQDFLLPPSMREWLPEGHLAGPSCDICNVLATCI